MREIVYIGTPVLHQESEPVSDTQIGSAKLNTILDDMKEALHSEKFGVAIAAPQVAVPLRIFIIAGHVFASIKDEEYDKKVHLDEVFINPEILNCSKKKEVGDEGCLSVPGKYGTKVERFDKVTIRYKNENGEVKERGASGFLARIFQHEIDHLNGILYTDHALEVIDVDDNLKPL